MQQPPHKTIRDERRNYFRIEADVLLNYLATEQSSALANQIPQAFSEDQRFTLMRDLRDIDHESNKYLRPIAESNRDLETYLKLLSKKIDILAATFANSLDPTPEQQNRHISLSEGGLSFTTQSELNKNSYITLQLTLLPSYVTLVLFAKVINCSKTENGFKIAISFVNLKDSDRQLIAKHIMQLQLAAKRKQHSEKD